MFITEKGQHFFHNNSFVACITEKSTKNSKSFLNIYLHKNYSSIYQSPYPKFDNIIFHVLSIFPVATDWHCWLATNKNTGKLAKK